MNAPSCQSALFELIDEAGVRHGSLVLTLLARDRSSQTLSPLLDFRQNQNKEELNGLEPVQLLESWEYVFDISIERPTHRVTTDRPEVIEPDDASGTHGRLRTGLHTGRLPIAIFVDGQCCGQIAFEVRSRKLDYLNHYRWMMRDLAESVSELVMERFAVSEQHFTIDARRDASTIYQQFEFLKSLLESEIFESAIQLILHRPYVAWMEEAELRKPQQGARATASVIRQVSRPGPRVELSPGMHSVASLPARLWQPRASAALDNVPNRFVRFAFERWRSAVGEVQRALLRERNTAAVTRGLREVAAVLAKLDRMLSSALLQQVGRLEQFPSGNQVLQKRAGYRDILRAYSQFELAAQLSWKGGEDVYGGGQRDVATLYEYWAFFELIKTVSSICERPLDLSQLVEVRPDGMAVTLVRGKELVVESTLNRLGRDLRLQLYFNRTFRRGAHDGSSWTRDMRPDISLCVRGEKTSPPLPPVWLHFDAKYRVDHFKTLLDEPGESTEDSLVKSGETKREDLLKMHAYRDAIRRSAGAYVLYPGMDQEVHRTYHELLPGLGAFALRPSNNGEASGRQALRTFLEDALTHLATQSSRHERQRYWTEKAQEPSARSASSMSAAWHLRRPPADTPILLGYVKSPEPAAWILSSHRYNLRADERTGSVTLNGPELSAELAFLYGPALTSPQLWQITGPPEIATRERLLDMGYPAPGGTIYLCLVLGKQIPDGVPGLTDGRLYSFLAEREDRAARGAPQVVSWLDLLLAAA